MKKAETIKDVFHIFAYEKFLKKEDKDFYVELYHNDFLRFVTALRNNELPSKSFFIAGQSGNGKSSVLNLLTTQYPDIGDKYEFNYIVGRKIFMYEDIDIIDLLLMIGNVLTKDNEVLKKSYFDKLKNLEDIKDGSKEESRSTTNSSSDAMNVRAELSVGAKLFSMLKASIDFESSYKINEEIRKDARQFFKIKRKELIDLINEIIFEYKKNINKELIVVIDDLEKKDNVNALFLKDMPLLNELNIVKIITMPIHLHRNENFPASDIREFGLKLKTFDGEKNLEDEKLLEEVIKKRLENKNLITNKAIKLAIKYSGANLRQLIKLIHIGAEEALAFKSHNIDDKEIQNAINRIQRDYSSKVMNMKKFLYDIDNGNGYEESEENIINIEKATKMELVFACFNGIVWYEINPIIKKPLEIYLRR